ncbi:MAG: T9SS type A sorting domain-containing protein [Flavobacteriales bacterium]|nr:T9SS type A sorting domain-containing protein [Flavobacteriales bacterium]
MNLHWPAARMGCVLGCLGLFAALRCEAQNLVPNPGFEETDSCRHILGLDQIHDWYSAYLTPDHLQSCLPYGAANGLPMNMFTYQQPYEGNSCVGLFCYTPYDAGVEQREWIMVPLLDTLVPGQTYYCSFRANAGFGGNLLHPTIWLASNHVGMLFTTYDRHWYYGDAYPAPINYAHIEYPQILADTVGWSLVSGSFVADSAYTYLMIGNFFSNALTDTVHLAEADSVLLWWDNSYTLIDAVCVSPNPGGCVLSHGIEEAVDAGPFVYPNPATDVLVIGQAMGRGSVVLDMLGRKVWSAVPIADRQEIVVRDWARGAYVLKVDGGLGAAAVKFVLTE